MQGKQWLIDWVSFFLRFILFHLSVYLCTCLGAHTGKKGVSDPLEPEIQVFVRHLIPMLGTELWSSERAGSILPC